MSTSREIIVQAGWYACPKGLPQLRWWDGFRWTELVADSEPIVEIETTFVDYDDELASRRQNRSAVTWEIPVLDEPTSCRCCSDLTAHDRGRLQLTA